MEQVRSRSRIARCVGLLSCAWVIGCALSGCAPSTANPGLPPGVELYIKGVEQSRRGNGDQAIATLEQAVAINPNLRMAHAMLGDAYRAKGDYTRAAAHYEAVTKLDEYAFVNHYNLGVTYQLLNKLQEAALAYIHALELNPKDVKTNMNLGLVFLALGKLDSAVTSLQRAADLDPNNQQAWGNLGVALDARGNTADAEATYRRALELNSNDLVTLQNLAQNLISQKKSGEALALMERALQSEDSPITRKRYGDAYMAGKKFDDAIRQYDLALAKDTKYLPALNEKGFALIGKYVDGLELNDKQRLDALALWRESLKVNPTQPRISDALRKWENPGLFGN